MKQHEVVELALQQSGGYATLGCLYNSVTKMPEWQSKSLTQFASIRRIVQETPGIFRIRPGLWGLKAQKEAIGKELALSDYAPPQKVEAFSHSYYQGLLVEVGNFRHFKTAVPAQDKNKQFLKHKLSELTTLPKPYDFTFNDIMGKAKTIDVSWFNTRRFPEAFFEVEHTTDIKNSLIKFVEFQDFRVKFWIVADGVRQSQFEAALKSAAFAPVQGRVSFLSYEKLSEWHSDLGKSSVHEKQFTIT